MLSARLSLMTFLQFAVWGCYLVSLGQFLGSSGLGRDIQWFYAAGGFSALIMPALAGAVADRYVPAQRMLGLCHFLSALFMFAVWGYAVTAVEVRFWPLFALFALSSAFFAPTVALCNSTCFANLKQSGIDPVKAFPSIRIWGTIGFVAMMWLVNSLWVADGSFGFTLSETHPHAMSRLQYTAGQLCASAVTGVIAALYAVTLPDVPPMRNSADSRLKGWRAMPVIGSFRLLALPQLLPFFLFAMFIGVALQINNGYVTPYLTHFRAMPEFSTTFGASNATLLTSLSQISEAVWILPVGCVLPRIGIKKTIMCAIGAWVINFISFAFGNTGDGLWLIVSAMIVYGVAFDFYNIAGALFIDRQAPQADKSAAQGFMIMMSRGVGSSLGMIAAGAVVNTFCRWEVTGGMRSFMGDWQSVWLIFTAYAAILLIAFSIFFKQR